MKIVCISDTHKEYGKRQDPIQWRPPKGDLLINAGDISLHGKIDELAQYNSWVARQDFEQVITVPGNHDFLLEKNEMLARQVLKDTVVLIDEPFDFHGILIWGSPWVPEYGHYAFNLKRGKALAEKWARIPNNVDLLITHGPPHGIGDKTDKYSERSNMLIGWENIGCEELRRRVEVVRPRWHVFGHVHGAHGIYREEGLPTTLINAATWGPRYKYKNPAIVIDTETGEVKQEPFTMGEQAEPQEIQE